MKLNAIIMGLFALYAGVIAIATQQFGYDPSDTQTSAIAFMAFSFIAAHEAWRWWRSES